MTPGVVRHKVEQKMCPVQCPLHLPSSSSSWESTAIQKSNNKSIKYFYSTQPFIPPRQMDTMIINTWYSMFETLMLFIFYTSSMLVLICAFNMSLSKCETKFVKQSNRTCETLSCLSHFLHFEKHEVLWVLYMKILQLQLVIDANEPLTVNHI